MTTRRKNGRACRCPTNEWKPLETRVLKGGMGGELKGRNLTHERAHVFVLEISASPCGGTGITPILRRMLPESPRRRQTRWLAPHCTAVQETRSALVRRIRLSPFWRAVRGVASAGIVETE